MAYGNYYTLTNILFSSKFARFGACTHLPVCLPGAAQMLVGAGGASIFLFLFSIARTVRAATACHLLVTFFDMAFAAQANMQNYLEVVTGADAGVVRAFGNTGNNLLAFLVPLIGVRLFKATGAWWPHFAAMGALRTAAAVLYTQHCAVEPPRPMAGVTNS